MEEFDCIVVGAGISGVGVALKASALGAKVLLLDRDKALSATSANSLRIIHGGFRYLQKFQISRLYQSFDDQEHLLNWASGYIKPLTCVMPLRKAGLKSPAPAKAGCALFKALTFSRKKSIPGPFVANAGFVERELPILKGKAPHGALVWHDALVEDQEGFHTFLLAKLRAQGVVLREGVSISGIERRQGWQVHAGTSVFNSRALVNAAGAWIEDIRQQTGLPCNQKYLWCKAFNISITKQFDSKLAFGLESDEGRLFFVVPREGRSVLGTAYIACDREQFVAPSEIELQRFISGFNSVMPEVKLKLGDVCGVDFGFLPIRSVEKGIPKLVDREEIHAVDGYVEVRSTKYTTFLSQGAAVCRALRIE